MGRVKFQIDCRTTPRHGVAANRLTIIFKQPLRWQLNFGKKTSLSIMM